MTALAAANPIEVAYLETYLFEKVGPHFSKTGIISKEDFWLILIWKANRSKNNTRRALEQNGTTFKNAVAGLAESIFNKICHKDRLVELVIEQRLGLATSSAILTVLYPLDFTVYDIRVCDELGGHHKLANCCHPDRLWSGYQKFLAAVVAAEPAITLLRDKDKSLWGRSLLKDIDKELMEETPTRKPRELWDTKAKRAANRRMSGA